MAKFNLMENETLFGAEQASHIVKFLMLPKPNPGNLYVTNMRVIFDPTQGRATSAFTYPLSEIESFSLGGMSGLTLTLKNGDAHKLTGLFNKKLAGYLEAAGVKKA